MRYLVLVIHTNTKSYLCSRFDSSIVLASPSWWRHQMETFSTLLAIYAGNSPVTGEFPSQSPVTRSFDVFFDLRLNTRLSKQWWGWWFETPLRSLWRHHWSWFNAVPTSWHLASLSDFERACPCTGLSRYEPNCLSTRQDIAASWTGD